MPIVKARPISSVRAARYLAQEAARFARYVGRQAVEQLSQWVGVCTGRRGLVGDVDPAVHEQVLCALDPDGTSRLQRQHHAGKRQRLGDEITISFEKQISECAIWDRQILNDAFDSARLAIGLAERRFTTRRGSGTLHYELVAGMTGTLTLHESSNAGDIQVHLHATVAPDCLREDGTTGRIHGVYQQVGFIKDLVAADFSSKLIRRGYEGERTAHGWIPVRVPDELVEFHSKRSREIEQALGERGWRDTPTARAVLAVDTRTYGGKEETPEERLARWRHEACAFGFTQEQALKLRSHIPPPPLSVDELDKLACGELRRLEESGRAAFTRGELDRAVLRAGIGTGTPALELLAASERAMLLCQVRELGQDRRGESYYASRERLEVEARAMEAAHTLHAQPTAGANEHAIDVALHRFDKTAGHALSEEQRNAVYHLTGSSAGLVLVDGVAGAGKTTMLSAAREVWQGELGLSVVGCAPTAIAARGLEDEAKIRSITVDRLLLILRDAEKHTESHERSDSARTRPATEATPLSDAQQREVARVERLLERAERQRSYITRTNLFVARKKVELFEGNRFTEQERRTLSTITRGRGAVQFLGGANGERLDLVLKAAAGAWRTQRRQVLHISSSREAAARLEKATGIHSISAAGFVRGLRTNRGLLRGYDSAMRASFRLGDRSKRTSFRLTAGHGSARSFLHYLLAASGRFLRLDRQSIVIVDNAVELKERLQIVKDARRRGARLVFMDEHLDASQIREGLLSTRTEREVRSRADIDAVVRPPEPSQGREEQRLPDDIFSARIKKALGVERLDLVVLDEAAMVAPEKVAALLERAQGRFKVAMVGDPRQLAPVRGFPGTFEALCDQYGAARLIEIQRQRSSWAREQVRVAREGDIQQAFAAYAEMGRLRLETSREAAMDQLVRDWKAVGRPDDTLVLTQTRAAAEELNRRIQAVRLERGELGGAGAGVALGGGTLYRGDAVRFTTNDRGLGVVNGERGRVVSTLPLGAVAVETEKRIVLLPRARISELLTLAYASTTHAVQGATSELSFVLLERPPLDAALSYVQLSRARGVTRFYADASRTGEELGAARRALEAREGQALRFARKHDPANAAELERDLRRSRGRSL